MKMQQLKEATYQAWENLSRFNGAVVQPQTFKPEMRCFGDLRYKATWEKAYCNFVARNKADACLDAYELITVQFNYAPDHSAYYLRHHIFDAFMALPEGPELLKTGLEQLFGAFTPETKAEAHGFYRLVQEHPEDSEETQLDLLNSSSQPIRGRVDGAVIRKDFTRAIQESGGDDQAQANSTAGMTRELFDCEVKDLYRETGGKRGDRTTLPAEAQKAYMVGETVATHDLKQAGKFDGNQQQVNRQIEDTVVDSSRKARKLFPW